MRTALALLALCLSLDAAPFPIAPIFDPPWLRSAPATAAFSPATYQPLLAWWKADSFDLTNNAPVGGSGREWQDQSTFDRDATTTNATEEPLFKTSIFGSMPSLRFDGSSDLLTFALLTITGSVDSATVIVVGKSLNNTDGEVLGNITDNVQFRVNRSGNNVSFFGGSTEAISATFSQSLTNLMMITWRLRGTAAEFRENKTEQGTNVSIGGPNTWSLNRIGRTSFGGYANWDFAEIAIWRTNLSYPILDALYDDYFKPRWGLP